MEIRYTIKREEVEEIIKNFVIGKQFPEGMPEGMKTTINIESYGASKVEIFKEEGATDE